MKELLSTPRDLAGGRGRRRSGRRRPHVRLRATAGGRGPAVRRRRADRRVGQRRLRRGGRGRGDRAGPRDRQRPGHPLRHQRRGGVGRRAWPAAARSTSSSSRPCPSAAVRGRRGLAGRRRPRRGRRHAAPRGLATGRRSASTRRGRGAPPAPELVVHDDGRLEGTLGDPARWTRSSSRPPAEALRRGLSRTVEIGDRSLFIEVFPVRPRLVVVGAVEVARSLVRLARELGFETVVIDGRPSFATPERFPDVDRLVVGWPDEVADEIGLGPNDAVAVLTHDVKFDEPAIVEALRRGCRYVGAVGSKKTQGDRRQRLLDAGVTAGRAGPTARPGRAGPRRSPAGRDRPGDPRRGRRRAVRRQRRPAEGAARRDHGPETVTGRRPRGRCRDRGSAAASCWRRSRGRPVLQHVLDRRRRRRASTTSSSCSATTPRLIERAIDWRSRAPRPEPGSRAAACPARSASASRALGPEAEAALIVARRPAADPDGGGDRACSPPAPTATRPIVVPRYAGDAGRNPVLLGRAAFRLVDEAERRPRPRPGPRRPPRPRPRGRRRRRQSGRRHARRPRRAPRDRLGRARPRQQRTRSIDIREVPGRHRLLRAGHRPLPGRPDPDRRAGPGRAPARSSSRARRGSTSGPAPVATPCRSPVRWPRPAGRSSRVDPSRGMLGRRCARSPPSTTSTTSVSSRLAGRMAPPRQAPRTSRSSPTSATTSPRSGRSSPRWRRRRGGSASPC